MYLYIHASTRYHAIKALKHMVAPETVDNLHSTSRALSSSAMPSAFKSVRYVSVNRPLLLFFYFFFAIRLLLNLCFMIMALLRLTHTSAMPISIGLFRHTNKSLLTLCTPQVC